MAMDWGSLKGWGQNQQGGQMVDAQGNPAAGLTATHIRFPDGSTVRLGGTLPIPGAKQQSPGSVGFYTPQPGADPQAPGSPQTAPAPAPDPQPAPTQQAQPQAASGQPGNPLVGWAQMQQINNQPRPTTYQRQRMPRWSGRNRAKGMFGQPNQGLFA